MVNTGNAVFRSAEAVKEKIRKLAGALIECDPADIELKDSRAFVTGAPDTGLSFGELAFAAQRHKVMAECGGPGLVATELSIRGPSPGRRAFMSR